MIPITKARILRIETIPILGVIVDIRNRPFGLQTGFISRFRLFGRDQESLGRSRFDGRSFGGFSSLAGGLPLKGNCSHTWRLGATQDYEKGAARA